MSTFIAPIGFYLFLFFFLPLPITPSLFQPAGNLSNAGLRNALAGPSTGSPLIPQLLYAFFQMEFACVTVSIFSPSSILGPALSSSRFGVLEPRHLSVRYHHNFRPRPKPQHSLVVNQILRALISHNATIIIISCTCTSSRIYFSFPAALVRIYPTLAYPTFFHSPSSIFVQSSRSLSLSAQLRSAVEQPHFYCSVLSGQHSCIVSLQIGFGTLVDGLSSEFLWPKSQASPKRRDLGGGVEVVNAAEVCSES